MEYNELTDKLYAIFYDDREIDFISTTMKNNNQTIFLIDKSGHEFVISVEKTK